MSDYLDEVMPAPHEAGLCIDPVYSGGAVAAFDPFAEAEVHKADEPPAIVQRVPTPPRAPTPPRVDDADDPFAEDPPTAPTPVPEEPHAAPEPPVVRPKQPTPPPERAPTPRPAEKPAAPQPDVTHKQAGEFVKMHRFAAPPKVDQMLDVDAASRGLYATDYVYSAEDAKGARNVVKGMLKGMRVAFLGEPIEYADAPKQEICVRHVSWIELPPEASRGLIEKQMAGTFGPMVPCFVVRTPGGAFMHAVPGPDKFADLFGGMPYALWDKHREITVSNANNPTPVKVPLVPKCVALKKPVGGAAAAAKKVEAKPAPKPAPPPPQERAAPLGIGMPVVARRSTEPKTRGKTECIPAPDLAGNLALTLDLAADSDVDSHYAKIGENLAGMLCGKREGSDGDLLGRVADMEFNVDDDEEEEEEEDDDEDEEEDITDEMLDDASPKTRARMLKTKIQLQKAVAERKKQREARAKKQRETANLTGGPNLDEALETIKKSAGRVAGTFYGVPGAWAKVLFRRPVQDADACRVPDGDEVREVAAKFTTHDDHVEAQRAITGSVAARESALGKRRYALAYKVPTDPLPREKAVEKSGQKTAAKNMQKNCEAEKKQAKQAQQEQASMSKQNKRVTLPPLDGDDEFGAVTPGKSVYVAPHSVPTKEERDAKRRRVADDGDDDDDDDGDAEAIDDEAPYGDDEDDLNDDKVVSRKPKKAAAAASHSEDDDAEVVDDEDEDAFGAARDFHAATQKMTKEQRKELERKTPEDIKSEKRAQADLRNASDRLTTLKGRKRDLDSAIDKERKDYAETEKRLKEIDATIAAASKDRENLRQASLKMRDTIKENETSATSLAAEIKAAQQALDKLSKVASNTQRALTQGCPEIEACFEIRDLARPSKEHRDFLYAEVLRVVTELRAMSDSGLQKVRADYEKAHGKDYKLLPPFNTTADKVMATPQQTAFLGPALFFVLYDNPEVPLIQLRPIRETLNANIYRMFCDYLKKHFVAQVRAKFKVDPLQSFTAERIEETATIADKFRELALRVAIISIKSDELIRAFEARGENADAVKKGESAKKPAPPAGDFGIDLL
jgi:hypothetical protein